MWMALYVFSKKHTDRSPPSFSNQRNQLQHGDEKSLTRCSRSRPPGRRYPADFYHLDSWQKMVSGPGAWMVSLAFGVEVLPQHWWEFPRSVFTWSCAYTESRDWVLRCCAPGFRFSGESVAHSFASFLLILRLTHVWKAPSGQQFLPVFASFESSRIDVLRMLKMRVPSWTP